MSNRDSNKPSRTDNENRGTHGGPKEQRKRRGLVARTCAEPDPTSLRSLRRANGSRGDGPSKAQRRAAKRLAARIKDFEEIVNNKAGRCNTPTSHFHRPGSNR